MALKDWIKEHKGAAAAIGGVLVALPLMLFYFHKQKQAASKQALVAPPSFNGGLPSGGGGGGDSLSSAFTPDPQTQTNTTELAQMESAMTALTSTLQTIQANMNALPTGDQFNQLQNNYNSISAELDNLKSQYTQMKSVTGKTYSPIFTRGSTGEAVSLAKDNPGSPVNILNDAGQQVGYEISKAGSNGTTDFTANTYDSAVNQAGGQWLTDPGSGKHIFFAGAYGNNTDSTTFTTSDPSQQALYNNIVKNNGK